MGSSPIFYDNKTVVDLTANLVYHARTKDIELDTHFIREKITHSIVRVVQITSHENLADVLTIGLGKVPHWFCLSHLGLTFSTSTTFLCRGSNIPSTLKQKNKDVVREVHEDEDELMTVQRGANKTIYSHCATSKPIKHKLLIPFIQTVPYEV